MKRKLTLCVCLLLTLSGAGAPTTGAAYEVWVIDQFDTTADGGGTLYI